MKKPAYSALGAYFEYLNRDCGYEQWSQYLIEKLSLPVPARGLDLGCGNGYFVRSLSQYGYKMTGVDVSPEMLSRAQELALASGVRAEFLLGDITKLKVGGKKFDFAIAVNDCINYVRGDKLLRAFRSVSDALVKGAPFIFDISSERKLREVLGDNLFCDDEEDYTLIWFNELFGDRVEMDLTLFTRADDGRYTRADERQTQYIHTRESVLSALREAGFSAECEDFSGDGSRLVFITEKL